MSHSLSHEHMLKAFINAAQYLAGLTSVQDTWEEAGKVLINFFGADLAAFGKYGGDGGIELGHWVFSDRGASAQLPVPEMTGAVRNVFESGFLTFFTFPSGDPITTAYFPILHNNRVIAVMLVGRVSCSSMDKETLDLYLAAAGLIGATYSRKISETAVLQAKEDWERTFDAVPDMITLLDLEHRIIRVNKAMAVKLGMTPEECIGHKCYCLINGANDAPLDCPYARVILDGLEHTIEMHDNRLGADYLITVSPLRDKDGRLIGGVHVARDITQRKLTEKELERHRAHLEELVEERTSELTAANRELEGFSYSVSHDLRAPLRHMIGYTELLLKSALSMMDETSAHYVRAILASAKKMGTLIDDLLAFSRMGRAEMRIGKVNLSESVIEAIHEIRHEASGRDIIWEIGELPSVYGDRAMLNLVFINLISNAIKYTSARSGAEIRIGCKEEGDEIICSIKDNGAGFDMRYVDKLFGVFQRLHTQDEFEGVGIGLANVRRIISRHGGRTWAEGSVGQGATFYFTLPKRS